MNNLYIDVIEKIATISDKQHLENALKLNGNLVNRRLVNEAKTKEEELIGGYNKDLANYGTEQLKSLGTNIAGIGSAGAGVLALDKVRKEGLIDGRLRRYHSAANENVDGIKNLGILSSKATDPNYNKLTSTLTNLNNSEMEGLTYLAKDRYSAKSVSAQRDLAKSTSKNDLMAQFRSRYQDPQQRIKDAAKNNTILDVSIPFEDHKKLNLVGNPEMRGAKNIKEYVELVNQGIIPGKGKSKEEINQIFKILGEGTDTVKGDIDAKYIKGSQHYIKNSLGQIADYAKNNKSRFSKGLAGATAGVGLTGLGLYGMGRGITDSYKSGRKFNDKVKEFTKDRLDLYEQEGI